MSKGKEAVKPDKKDTTAGKAVDVAETKEVTAEELKVEHTAEVKALVDEIEVLKAERDSLIAENYSLKNKLDTFMKDPAELNRCQDTFKVDGVDYRFRIGYLKFRMNGEVVEAKDVIANKEMQRELVEIGFGGLEKVPAK